MTLRPALLTLLLALILPGAARSASLAGSLTLITRPTGASFRVSGDQEVAGQAPVTLEPWLPGTYRIEAFAAGYDRWRRTLISDGMTVDTLWMTLRPKNALKAGARALVLPGWGQFYDQHPGRGTVVMASLAAAGVGLGLTHLRLRDREDERAAAYEDVLAAQTSEELTAAVAVWDRAHDRWGSAQRLRAGFIWSTVGIWGLSVIDAMAFVPRPAQPALLGTSGTKVAGDLGVAMTVARVRF
jgi:hypothetical protein